MDKRKSYLGSEHLLSMLKDGYSFVCYISLVDDAPYALDIPVVEATTFCECGDFVCLCLVDDVAKIVHLGV